MTLGLESSLATSYNSANIFALFEVSLLSSISPMPLTSQFLFIFSVWQMALMTIDCGSVLFFSRLNMTPRDTPIISARES